MHEFNLHCQVYSSELYVLMPRPCYLCLKKLATVSPITRPSFKITGATQSRWKWMPMNFQTHFFHLWNKGVLVSFWLSPWHNQQSPGKRESQLRDCPDQIGLWPYLWGIVLIVDDQCGKNQPTVGSVTPRHVVLSCMRKETEHEAEGASQWAAFLQVFFFSSSCILPWLLLAMDCNLKL